jgi:hypothetical protein
MSSDGAARAALEAAQARLQALRAQLHAPIDPKPFEAEVAEQLKPLQLEKRRLTDEQVQLQQAIDALRPQATAAAEHLDRLRTPPHLSASQLVLTGVAGLITALVVITSDDLPKRPFVLWPLIVGPLLLGPFFVLVRDAWRAGLAAGVRRLPR